MFMRFGIGKRRRLLERQWREQHDPRLRRLQRVEQLLQPLLELRQALLALERFVRAVADEDHGRLQFQRQVHQLLEAAFGLSESKPAAGLAEDGVAAPAEVADGDVLVGVRGEQSGFPVAVRCSRSTSVLPIQTMRSPSLNSNGLVAGAWTSNSDESAAERNMRHLSGGITIRLLTRSAIGERHMGPAVLEVRGQVVAEVGVGAEADVVDLHAAAAGLDAPRCGRRAPSGSCRGRRAGR